MGPESNRTQKWVFTSCPGQTNSEAFVAAVVLTYYAGNLPCFEEADMDMAPKVSPKQFYRSSSWNLGIPAWMVLELHWKWHPLFKINLLAIDETACMCIPYTWWTWMVRFRRDTSCKDFAIALDLPGYTSLSFPQVYVDFSWKQFPHPHLKAPPHYIKIWGKPHLFS